MNFRRDEKCPFEKTAHYQNMKTARFQNGSLDPAKETLRNTPRVAAARPARVRGNGAANCDSPAPTTGRRRVGASLRPDTKVAAKIDVGFGNALYIRGEGAGLSWDKGEPLVCVEGSTWVWTSRHADESITFKLLVNDQLWCRGENIKAGPGRSIEVVPSF